MTTYTIAYDEILYACVPDGDDAALERELCEAEEQGRIEIDRDAVSIESGLMLTDEPPDDECLIAWQGHDAGWLSDESGTTYEYAIRPLKRRSVWAK